MKTVTPSLFTSFLLALAAGLLFGNNFASAAEPTANASKDNNKEDSNKVLRHAVYFSFKETATQKDIDGVVKAFEALPTKIDSIKGFEWGVRTNSDKQAGGFTHCFTLTFDDEAGRSKYLPHDAHKAFGNVLRPHMKGVFVIDYWGTQEAGSLKKTLRHTVFLKLKDGTSQEDLKRVETNFAALPSKIDTIKAFEWGTNNSPEKHDAGFTHCFRVTFDSKEGLETYSPHKAHQDFVKVLSPVMDKVRVIDFWVAQ